MSDSVRPHRRQPTRLPCPWDSPGKNTGVGCHFLLQCVKVKSESEVAQSTLSNPMDCSLPGSSVHGIFQVRVLEWGAIAFSEAHAWPGHKSKEINSKWHIWSAKGGPIWILIDLNEATNTQFPQMSKCFNPSVSLAQNSHDTCFSKFSSVQFSHSVVSDSLRPHDLQQARPPYSSPTPGVYSNSCPVSRWCHPTIPSSVIPFSSCLQSFLASGSFPMSQLFA